MLKGCLRGGLPIGSAPLWNDSTCSFTWLHKHLQQCEIRFNKNPVWLWGCANPGEASQVLKSWLFGAAATPKFDGGFIKPARTLRRHILKANMEYWEDALVDAYKNSLAVWGSDGHLSLFLAVHWVKQANTGIYAPICICYNSISTSIINN